MQASIHCFAIAIAELRMTSFNDVPPEIVAAILGFVLPADLENFALASKLIQTLAQHLLKDHRLRIRKYTNITNHHPTLPIGDVLKDVLRNPRIGYYVRSLFIDVSRGHVDYEQYTCEELDTFMAAARDSKYIARQPNFSPPFDYDYWRRELTRTNEDLLLAIIVPLLPGLEEIMCSEPFMNNFVNSKFVEMIHRSPESLRRLMTVLMYGSGNGRTPIRQDYRLDDIAKFGALPSMRKLTVTNPRPFFFGQNGVSAKASGVSELDFQDSYVLPPDMSKYLGCFSQLRSVSLTASPNLEFVTFAKSKPSLIVDALRSQARLTLQRLVLRGPRLHKDALKQESEALMRKSCVMGSLCEFSSLTEVSTDWALLIPQKCDFESWLSTTLSNSIEVLHLQLHESLISREFASFVKGLVATKIATNLSKLRNLVFVTAGNCKHLETRGRSLKPGCDDVGLELQFEDESTHDRRPDRFS